MKTKLKKVFQLAPGDIITYMEDEHEVEGVDTTYSRRTGKTYNVYFTCGEELTGLSPKAQFEVVIR